MMAFLQKSSPMTVLVLRAFLSPGMGWKEVGPNHRRLLPVPLQMQRPVDLDAYLLPPSKKSLQKLFYDVVILLLTKLLTIKYMNL